eukprot:637388-Ditylum_brightwellii.AAC.1
MEHDFIFLDKYNESDSDGSDNGMLMRREVVLDCDKSLTNRFADIVEGMFEQEKEKGKEI